MKSCPAPLVFGFYTSSLIQHGIDAVRVSTQHRQHQRRSENHNTYRLNISFQHCRFKCCWSSNDLLTVRSHLECRQHLGDQHFRSANANILNDHWWLRGKKNSGVICPFHTLSVKFPAWVMCEWELESKSQYIHSGNFPHQDRETFPEDCHYGCVMNESLNSE